MTLRILHTADSHIGADLPVRRDGKYRRRGADFIASFRSVLARAHELQVDVVIHAGDLFDRSRPGAGAIAAATEPLWQTAQAGIPVVIVPGNHERSVLPAALLLSHANIHVLRAPGTVVLARNGVRLAIAGFPCLRRNAAARFAEALHATGWQQARADVNVLVAHQTFTGARCGPANFQFRDGDDVVPPAAVPAAFHYVAAGHIHRHQALPTAEPGRPVLVYSGSPDRIAFAELGEPKGCVVVEFADGRVRPCFVEHAVRPMEILPLDVTGTSGAEVAARVLAVIRAAPADAVVQVRLSGQTTRRTLAGLRLAALIHAARPDLTASVSAQAVEWITDRAACRVAHRRLHSVFEVLHAPPAAEIITTAADNLAALPAACGTYALHDAGGRLLYIGKAVDLRTRVRSHLRRSAAGNHFRGWTRHIAHISARLAGSELEALLVEADLVRRLAPPFNRQMRLWKRYRYLCATGRPFGQLQICPEPLRAGLAFGPLRSRARAEEALEALSVYFGLARCPDDASRPAHTLLPAFSPAGLCARHFAGHCCGPCGGRTNRSEYVARLRARDALLSGADSPEAASIHEELERIAAVAVETPDAPAAARERVLRTLAALHEQAVVLRAARDLLDRPLALPAAGNGQMIATITRNGLHLAHVGDCPPAARPVAPHSGRSRPLSDHASALPKSVADCLCTAVRYLRRQASAEPPSSAEPPQPAPC